MPNGHTLHSSTVSLPEEQAQENKCPNTGDSSAHDITLQAGVQLRPGQPIYSGSTLVGMQFPEAFKSITLVIGCDFVST
jgi:hypothetical protein